MLLLFVALAALDPPGLVARIGTSNPGGFVFATSADGLRHYAGDFPPCSTSGTKLLGVFVTDAKTGRCLNSYRPLTKDEVLCHVALAPDGFRFLVMSWQSRKCRLRVVDPDTGRVVREGEPWDPPGDNGFNVLLGGMNTHAPVALFEAGEGTSLIDPETGKLTPFDPPFGDGQIRNAPDNRSIVVTLPDGAVRVYAVPVGKQRGGFANPGDELELEGFAAGGRLAVWVRRGKEWSHEVREFDGKLVRTLVEKQPNPGRVLHDPSGRTVLFREAFDEDKLDRDPWRLLDAATGREIARFPDLSDWSSTFRYSADGETVIVLSGREQTEVTFDAATGRRLASVPKPVRVFGDSPRVGPFQFTPDGKLVGVADGHVLTWDSHTGRELARAAVSGVQFREFDTVGEHLRLVNHKAADVVRNLRTGVEVPFPRREAPRPPDGRGGMLSDWLQAVPEQDGWTVRVLAGKGDRPGSNVWAVKNGKAPLTAFDIAPGGKRLVLSGEDKEDAFARLRDVVVLDLTDAKGEPARLSIDHPAHVGTGAAFSADGRWLVACGEKTDYKKENWPRTTHLTVFDLSRRVRDAEVQLPLEGPWLVRFTPDGRWLVACGTDGEVLLIEPGTWRVRAKVRPPGDMGGERKSGGEIRWSHDGRLFAVSTPDGRVAVWDVARVLAAWAK